MSNTPDFKNQEFLKYENKLQLVNDIYKGVDSAKKYIKKFAREDDADYQNRLDEATLDNFVFRTVDAIKNIIFRKEINLDNVKSKELLNIFEKVNYKDDLNNFAKKILANRVRDGKTYILVDSPSYDPDVIVSKADLENNNIRPYFINILRYQLINWELDSFNNYTRIAFYETYDKRVGRYGLDTLIQVKQFELVDNKVEMTIWRDGELFDGTILNINKIPLIEVGTDDTPPLYDQAKINVNHLNRNSEKSNYVRVGAAPFPIVWGQVSSNDGAKTLSINQGLHFQGNKNEAGFEWAEMSGKNYDIIQREIEYREKQMERISIEFVTQLKNATATEIEKASTSNESRLLHYANELEVGLNSAIKEFDLYYTNSLGENYISINKDYDSNILTPQQVQQLITLRTNGDLSYDMLISMLIQGEIIPYLDEKQREEEKMKLRDEGNI